MEVSDIVIMVIYIVLYSTKTKLYNPNKQDK